MCVMKTEGEKGKQEGTRGTGESSKVKIEQKIWKRFSRDRKMSWWPCFYICEFKDFIQIPVLFISWVWVQIVWWMHFFRSPSEQEGLFSVGTLEGWPGLAAHVLPDSMLHCPALSAWFPWLHSFPEWLFHGSAHAMGSLREPTGEA